MTQGDMFSKGAAYARILRERGIDMVESAEDPDWVALTVDLIVKGYPYDVVRSDHVKTWAANIGWPDW